VLPNQKGADRFKLHVQGSEAWIERREEASMAELEGSIDSDVYTCNWSNLVGHGCSRLRCKRAWRSMAAVMEGQC
jgi:hypothetical protein